MSKQTHRKINIDTISELVSFGKVGAIGFVIDASILMALFHVLSWGHYESRAISFSIAVAVTWYLNRKYTFKKYANKEKYREYITYFSVQLIGSLLNLVTYFTLISVINIMSVYPIVPLALGAGVAMLFNYYASRTWVFNGRVEET